MRRTVIAICVVLSLAGCGLPNEPPSAQQVAVETQGSLSDSTNAASAKKMCVKIYDSKKNPLRDTVSLFLKLGEAKKRDIEAMNVDKVSSVRKDVKSLARRAPGSLKPPLLDVSRALGALQDAKAGSSKGKIDVDSAMVAIDQIRVVCQPLANLS